MKNLLRTLSRQKIGRDKQVAHGGTDWGSRVKPVVAPMTADVMITFPGWRSLKKN